MSGLAAPAGLTEAVELHLPEGLLGLEELTHWELAPSGIAAYLSLRSLEAPEVEFLALPGETVRTGLADAVAGLLGVAGGLLVLVLVSVQADGLVTANLAGPIVIDQASRAAAQLVILDDEFPIQYPLPV